MIRGLTDGGRIKVQLSIGGAGRPLKVPYRHHLNGAHLNSTHRPTQKGYSSPPASLIALGWRSPGAACGRVREQSTVVFPSLIP